MRSIELKRPYQPGINSTKSKDVKRRVLPTAPARSIWVKLFKETQAEVIRHLGGEDHLNELQRLAARRIAAFETEMVHLEDKFATMRLAGGEPDRQDLVLYSALANAQRRFCDSIGWERAQRDTTMTLSEYLSSKNGDDPPG
jgi:hypothetical protein